MMLERHLTPKQSVFADLIAGGLNQTEAYRRAYNAEGMNSDTVKVEAHRLSRHPKIVWAVDRLRKSCPSTRRMISDLSADWVISAMQDFAESPYTTVSQKLNALELLGKHLKMF
jgi:hypothetical protein